MHVWEKEKMWLHISYTVDNGTCNNWGWRLWRTCVTSKTNY